MSELVGTTRGWRGGSAVSGIMVTVVTVVIESRRVETSRSAAKRDEEKRRTVIRAPFVRSFVT
jgi:membrane protein involved in colicin uptake